MRRGAKAIGAGGALCAACLVRVRLALTLAVSLVLTRALTLTLTWSRRGALRGSPQLDVPTRRSTC